MRKSKNSSRGPAHREGVGLVDASKSEIVIVKSLGVPNCNPKHKLLNGMDRVDIETMTKKNMHELEATIGKTHPQCDVLRIHPNKKFRVHFAFSSKEKHQEIIQSWTLDGYVVTSKHA
ncbi:hypothetical protein VNO77_07894 [Canavalia gladiata]|uniref:Uncharacterized protein n=1 Tax=Canavalia gladiata TaxID=3824 RepID=A0AAN9M805_CANGL